MNTSSTKRTKKAGFTLLEVMVVLVIIGILAALVAPRISTYIRDAKITAAKAEITTIVSSLNSYFNTHSEYPASLYIIGKEYLQKAKLNDNKQLLDPWGIPYNYKTEDGGGLKNQRFLLTCAGEDNILGNSDDITESGGAKSVQEGGGDEYDNSLEGDSTEEDLR